MSIMDKLQMFSLVLEVVGLCLATTEILNESFARRIEKKVIEYLNIQRYFAIGEDTEDIHHAMDYGYRNIAIPLLLTLIILYLVGYFFNWEHRFIYAFLMSIGLFFLPRNILRLLKKLSGGRALGGAGLALAFCGVTIEAVQVWVIPQKVFALGFVVTALIIVSLCIKNRDGGSATDK